MRFTPELHEELRDVLRDERLSRAELAQALDAYPGLAAFLVRAAGRPGHAPDSLEQVLAQFGTRQVARSLERLWQLLERRDALVANTAPAAAASKTATSAA